MSFIENVKQKLEPIALHFIGMCAVVLSIWIFHFLLKLTIGEDAKLLDLIPIRYIAHIGDLVAFTKFLWSAIKEFKNE